MLLYCNRSQFRLMIFQYGSIFFRMENMTFSIVVAAAAAGLQHLVDMDSRFAPAIPHFYGIHALGAVVTFAVVFRTNLGWSRYWEAIGQLHTMYSKWVDVFSMLVAHSSVAAEGARASNTEAGTAKAKRIEDIVEHVFRNFVMMSAIAADRLTHGDTARMEQRAHSKVPWSQQLVKREALRNCDLTGATDLPQFEAPSTSEMGGRQTVRTTVCVNDYANLNNDWKATYRVRARPSKVEREILSASHDRTSIVMYWIIHDIAKVGCDLVAPPPIQSRMFQELSNGMLGFAQAVKLADVPFPFPYAQMLTLLLVCYACLIPVYVIAFTRSMVAGPIMSFALFQGIWGLNETAKELECPFGGDANDITVSDFHLRFIDSCDEIFYACTLRSGKEQAEDMRAMTPPPQPQTSPMNKTARRPSWSPRREDMDDRVFCDEEDVDEQKMGDNKNGCDSPAPKSLLFPDKRAVDLNPSSPQLLCCET